MSTKEYISLGEIFEADDVKYADVPVPEWGDGKFLKVRSPTAGDIGKWEKGLLLARTDGDSKAYERGRVEMVVRCLVHVDGSRVVNGPQQFESAVTKLMSKNSGPINRAFDAILKMAAVTPEDLAEMEGNSPAIHADTSPSISLAS